MKNKNPNLSKEAWEKLFPAKMQRKATTWPYPPSQATKENDLVDDIIEAVVVTKAAEAIVDFAFGSPDSKSGSDSGPSDYVGLGGNSGGGGASGDY